MDLEREKVKFLSPEIYQQEFGIGDPDEAIRLAQEEKANGTSSNPYDSGSYKTGQDEQEILKKLMSPEEYEAEFGKGSAEDVKGLSEQDALKKLMSPEAYEAEFGMGDPEKAKKLALEEKVNDDSKSREFDKSGGWDNAREMDALKKLLSAEDFKQYFGYFDQAEYENFLASEKQIAPFKNSDAVLPADEHTNKDFLDNLGKSVYGMIVPTAKKKERLEQLSKTLDFFADAQEYDIFLDESLRNFSMIELQR